MKRGIYTQHDTHKLCIYNRHTGERRHRERAGWKRMERGVYVYADIRDKHPRQTNKKEEN
jgi:hypothetical protein